MKFKKTIVSLVACITVAVMASSSFGAVYLTLKVKRATTAANGVGKLMLQDPNNMTKYKWFTAPTGSDDQALAVGLTAMSLGEPVRVGLSDANSTNLLEVGLNNDTP